MAAFSENDRRFMQLALNLARRGEGLVEPNPMVGCVLVKHGRIVGRGWHRRFGGEHAEPNALRDAGDAARGAAAYVTLEPCNHHGKTPPCTEALLAAGVARVVVAARDPHPLVAGRGLRRLRAAGLRVDVGLLRHEALRLIRPFTTYHLMRRPYVILKWAQSVDGRIATRTGDSKWISSIQSRRRAHALRARVDAIIVGVATVLADDPELTARLVQPRRVATRIVLDTRLRTPARAKLVKSARKTPTLIVTAPDAASSRRAAALRRAGCEVVGLPAGPAGLRLHELATELHRRGMTNVLVEGGGRVLGACLEAGLADEVHVFVSSRLIGGEAAPGPLRNRGPADMKSLPDVELRSRVPCGPDMWYTFEIRRPPLSRRASP